VEVLPFTILIFPFSQPIKLVDQGVYLPVGGLDLTLKECLLVTIFGCMAQGIDLYKQM